MLVAILSPYPQEIAQPVAAAGDSWKAFEKIDDVGAVDFVVSYGHRHIIREPHLSRFGNRLLNLHVGYLPWNRGADPNFWSFIDNTPKGVTLHVVDSGLDTGAIVAQRLVELSGTLATSYQQLRTAAASLFADEWPRLRRGQFDVIAQQPNSGTYHRSADKAELWNKLPLGFETPLEQVAVLGAQGRKDG